MASEVQYQDVFRALFKVTPVSQSNSAFVEDITKIHARLERDDVDYQDFFDNCLVSVNGFYHLLDTDGTNGLLVLDAVKSLNVSRQNQLGISNWRQLGGIKRYPIQDSWITTYLDDSPEKGTVRVLLPNTVDIENKTVIFCLGGYLRFIDGSTIVPTGSKLFKINFNNMPFLDIYYESKKYIDLSSLPLEHTLFNQEQISLPQLTSAENLRAYLKLSQSFVIVVNTVDIQRLKLHVKKTNLPGMYIGYSEPKYPLVVGQGRHAEYWAREEDGQYSITVHDNIVDKRLYDTIVRDANITSVDGAVRPDDPAEYSDAYLLKIYKA